jgi:formylglycine-generating enzyme required for sulfatase activity
MKKLILICSLFGLFHCSVMANNIAVTNVTLNGQNTDTQVTEVGFDLSWENSWRISVGPANWDAAWVFVKFRVNGNNWQHATIIGGIPSGGAAIDVTADNVGAFIYRSGDGSGDVSFSDLRLQWDYGTDGVGDNAVVDVQVFAIEMVYVPEGAFQLGVRRTVLNSSTEEIGHFYTAGSIPLLGVFPYDVTSEDAIVVGTNQGQLYYAVNQGDPGDQLGPIPATFPKGFAAFYCQKYETSQDQWVSFFNTLTPTQKTNLDITGPDGKNTDDEATRNAVSWPDAGSATTTLPNVPVNFVRNEFIFAYLDWAGLRPMTETEYEKSCRGTLPSVIGGFAWGTSNIHGEDYELAGAGTENELISNPGSGTGNANYGEANGTPNGPLRCGIFAASAGVSNREETGGSYYGIMELTGNVYERAISVGNPEGRAFTGNHGDGEIPGTGRHNVAGWPADNAGVGYRGGSYPNAAQFLLVSDRNDGANTFAGTNGRIGFRGVRTAQ